MLTADLALDEPQQGGGDRRIAAQAHDIERHRQVRRLPGRLDEIHGVHHVALFPGNQGEKRTGGGALADLGPRWRGADEQNESESDDE